MTDEEGKMRKMNFALVVACVGLAMTSGCVAPRPDGVESPHVVDRIENASAYCSRHALFGKAFEFVRSHDLRRLPVGRYEIAGADCYAMMQEIPLKSVAEGRYEFHRDYFDIQLPVDGEETYGLVETPNSVLDAARWDEKDILFFDAPMKTVTVRPGEFVMLAPLTGAHAPCLTEGGPRKVRKLVIKVRAAR